MEDFGIYIFKTDNGHINLCSCGNKWESKEIEPCSCGNKDFKNISSHYKGGKVSSGVKLKILEKGDWGFIVKRHNTNGKFDKTNMKLTAIGESFSIMCFDYRTNNFYIENSKGEKSPLTEYNAPYFFRSIEQDDFIDIVSTNKTKHLLEFALNNYGRGNRWYGDRKLYRGLPKIKTKPYYQILMSANFEQYFLGNYKDVIERRDYHLKDGSKAYFNPQGTTPHEIMELPKYLIVYLKKLNGSYQTFEGLDLLHKEYGVDNVKNILDKFLDECDTNHLKTFVSSNVNRFSEMVKNYNYEPKRLIEYICRDVKLNQGITSPSEALTLLDDYMKMMIQMNLHAEKYSKSLKKDHDIATLNYKVGKDSFTQDNFKKVVEQNTYKQLLYNDKEYSIVIPVETSDLIAEGQQLSHCVASYVEDVVKEKCKIIFIRKKDTPNESLLTIEIRNGKIIQVKGFGNRHPKIEEKQFISKWALDKKLMYSA